MQGAGGGAIAGVQTLPSTSTDSSNSQFPFASLGIVLMASGAVMLIRQRPQKPFTQ
jgi:LPXTG-motif cell wall-anchored protein